MYGQNGVNTVIGFTASLSFMGVPVKPSSQIKYIQEQKTPTLSVL